MKSLVTGGFGFIGSHLAERLVARGDSVVVFDNFSTGRREFLDSIIDRVDLVEGDVLDRDAVVRAAKGCDTVFHLAANADVRYGTVHPGRDLEQNTIATFNVLEAARLNGAKRFVFSSTGSVYGECPVIPTPEDAPFPVQTSLYGASKLAGEGLIEAFAEGFGLRGWIFRFVSVLGERYTHGHVFDFVKRLRQDPSHLHVLGDGHQKKSYVYVDDCVSAILLALERSDEKLSILNIGTDEYCEVNDSVKWICERLEVTPEITHEGGDRGWIGDNPFIFLDCSRLRALGWSPTMTIRDSVIRTVDYLRANPRVLERS